MSRLLGHAGPPRVEQHRAQRLRRPDEPLIDPVRAIGRVGIARDGQVRCHLLGVDSDDLLDRGLFEGLEVHIPSQIGDLRVAAFGCRDEALSRSRRTCRPQGPIPRSRIATTTGTSSGTWLGIGTSKVAFIQARRDRAVRSRHSARGRASRRGSRRVKPARSRVEPLEEGENSRCCHYAHTLSMSWSPPRPGAARPRSQRRQIEEGVLIAQPGLAYRLPRACRHAVVNARTAAGSGHSRG